MTLTLTAAEEGVFDASCAGETVYAASSLLDSFRAGVQEGCLDPSAADGATSAMAQVLDNYAPKLAPVLPPGTI
ncbi:acyl-dehydrogenase [Micractinium conductrix]|uniref:Acyl-dehydrogenase n=1 Tax=Micractinium conductrix TaxID=554055 RepID=A0A2P6VS98_9CHLO|nr:acyl-dehydrogenase [Micractinium conductrix]|eukprot:PSC76978.1 acyl-dehydrogenase [Micractinium conductrix]